MHERKAHMSLYIVLATFGMVVGMSAICNSVSAETQQSYSELERAVLDGKDIHITIDLAQCVVHDTTKAGPPVRGDIRFDAYMIVGNTIAFSLTHFTVRADNTPVNEFLSYRALSSGKVDVRSKFLNASTNGSYADIGIRGIMPRSGLCRMASAGGRIARHRPCGCSA